MKLSDLKPLHALGLSLIYLHSKEKRPLEKGWTSSPSKTWEELQLSFEKNYNVGVRLGAQSQIKGLGYLTCIDVDIKTPGARKAALARLKEVVGTDTYAEVRSGSGGGSRHLYCVSKEPFKQVTLGRVKGEWEICAYSTGRQMVLPPSIHPVTGFEYAWHVALSKKTLPVFDPGKYAINKNKDCGKSSFTQKHDSSGGDTFRFEEVNLYDTRVPLKWIKVIEDGVEKGERSETVLSAAMALCRCGLTDNQILSVLSDQAHALSDLIYEKSNPLEWLRDYNLVKAREGTDIARRFDHKPREVTPLSADEVEEEKAEERIEQGLLDQQIEARGFYGENKKPDYDALLRAFIKINPYKMIADMKAVYVFNGTHYVDLTPFEIKAFAERKLLPKPEDKLRQEFLHKVHYNYVERRKFFTSTTEGKINFKNGVIDLNVSSTDLIPHSAEYGFRGVLPYGYDPDAKCPVFKEWLDGVMLHDKDLTRVVQEFMGYIVRGGDYKYHKALWLGGVGRNGKSTFIDVLKALIGVGNFSVISIKSLIADKFAAAELDGKIANFSEETSPQELADSGPFKNLTGDGDIYAQKKYGDPFSYRNRAKLVMTYNTIPDLKDLSSGMLSRPVIIPFQKIIDEMDQDRDIKNKLFKELPGIFNFAMRGWNRLEQQGGFTRSQASELALEKVKEESCPVYQWVENNVRPKSGSAGYTTQPRSLYIAYAAQDRHAYKFIEFCRRMNAHPLIKANKKEKKDGNYYRVDLV